MGQFSAGRSQSPPEADFETLSFAFNHVRQSQALTALFRAAKKAGDISGHKIHYLLFAFPDRYVDTIIDELIHPEWRTACFSATCVNASNWATYGEQHRGVALVFRPQLQDERPFIPLVGAIGMNSGADNATRLVKGSIRGYLHPVSYSAEAPEIDFFRSMGNLPMGKLERAWRANAAGDRSKLIDEIVANQPEWRKAYWASFNRVATTKLEDWKHEEEYRIVLSDSLGLRKQNALVEYEFASLVGVVFGMRTSTRDKLEIMKVVAAQCEKIGRKDFEFHQMTYHAAKGALVRL